MKKVFIVDDHPILREGLAQIINKEKDFTVCGEAGDISGSFPAIKESKPDIAVIDLTLKDGSGLRLIENLRYYDTHLSILVYSMHDENIYAERCFKAGAKGYMMKQEPPEKLVSALKEISNGNLYVSSNLSHKFLHNFVNNKANEFKPSFDVLSNRELEVYQFFGKGLKKVAIAEQMNISVKTVETYIENIKRKMNFKTLHEIIIHSVNLSSDNVK